MHQCIRPLIGAFAPGHHGYQRAGDLISGQASTGHSGHQCSHAPGRPILHLFVSSRRPRQASTRSYFITRSSSHWVPLFVPEDGSFVPARTSSNASRAGAVKAGRRADLTPRTAVARPRLDGAEHGARIKRVGRPHHQSSSFRSHAPWRERPRRCGRACWRARSPARCDAIASCAPRSTI